MKKLIVTIAIIVATGSLLSAQAINEFSVYGGGGLSSLNYQLSQGNGSSGFGGDFGAGYTYLRFVNRAVETGTVVYQQMWGIHVGMGLGIYNATAKLNNVEAITSNLIDSENDGFDLLSKLSGYNETQTVMFLTIPVMGQYNIEQFYVMGGIKTGIPLNGKYKSKDATLTNEAYYPKYENWMKTQTFAGYGAFNGKTFDGDLDLGVSFMLSFEAGMNWNLGGNLVLYSGAYFDYGLNDISKGDKQKFINYTANNAENFTTNSVLTSYSDGSKSTAFTDKVNTMAVGIKLRLAFRK